MVQRDPEAIEALGIAIEDSQGSQDWFASEKNLSGLYRQVLTRDERKRWRETWLDIVFSEDKHSALCAGALVRTNDPLAIDPLLVAFEQGKLDTEIAIQDLNFLLDIGYEGAIETVRTVYKRPDANPSRSLVLKKADQLEAMIASGHIKYKNEIAF